MSRTSLPSEARGSPERFGYSWERFSDLTPEQEEQFNRWTAPLKPADWAGKRFLDVGCGAGRNSYWAMARGAAGGLAVDVDQRSLNAARRNLAPFPTVEVRHLSAYDLPAEPLFDIVFSIGVIHHLDAPEAAVARMVAATRPNGRVLVWLYGYENNEWVVRFFDPVRRAVFSRLPLSVVHFLSLPLTAMLWVFLRAGLGRIEYFCLLRAFPFHHLRHVVFDHMVPRIARYYSSEEAKKLLTDQGLVDLELIWVNGMSWTAMGRKPS